MQDSEVVKLIVSRCQNIEKHWDEHLAFWEGDIPGNYNDINVVARYLVDRYESQLTSDFEQIFDAIEALLLVANAPLKALLVVGLLEDIQNISSYREFGYGPFEKWLGPETKKAWNDVIRFWGGS